MKPFLIATLLGGAVSAIGWFAPPGYVTSTAVLSAKGLESPLKWDDLQQRIAQAAHGLRSRDRLTPVIRSFGLYPGVPIDEAVEVMQRNVTFERITVGPSQAVAVSFRYRHRGYAQRTAMWFVTEIMRSGQGFRLLDPASLPSDRTLQYRLTARFFGLPVGFITGLILSWRRQRIKVPTEILAAT